MCTGIAGQLYRFHLNNHPSKVAPPSLLASGWMYLGLESLFVEGFAVVVQEQEGWRMDSLDHMLTDPLELEGNCTRIMEDCMLGTTRVSLPEDLLEDVS